MRELPEGFELKTEADVILEKDYKDKDKLRAGWYLDLTEPHGEMRKKKQFTMIKHRMEEPLLQELSASNLATLIFLSTYMIYDGRIGRSEHYIFDKHIIAALTRMDRAQYCRFFNPMCDSGFISCNDGQYSLNQEIFKRGSIGKERPREQQGGEYRCKLYATGIRELYELHWKAGKEKIPHSKLGNLFRLIPFMNRYYNVICENPLEKNPDLIRPMTNMNIGTAFGLGYTWANKMENLFLNTSISVGAHREYILKRGNCDSLGEHGLQGIFVNPSLLCADNNNGSVSHMIDFHVPQAGVN
ncbi:MAG: hypothetical protein RR365_01090 [Bacteroides sp.]